MHLRKSNTEPIIRIYAESQNEKKADLLAQRIINDIKEIIKTAVVRGGFKIPSLELLFLLKLHALEGRRGSVKGQKDELDLLSLAILPEFNWQTYLAIVAKFNFTTPHELFLDFLDRTAAVKELGLNELKMYKVKTMIRTRCEIKK